MEFVICILSYRIILQSKNKKIWTSLKYKKYLIWPIKYIKHYKSTEYMKRTTLSINMIGNEKQKTWQKNTIFTSKMLKGLLRLNRLKYFKKVLHIYPLQYKIVKNPILTSSPKRKIPISSNLSNTTNRPRTLPILF